jgi:hypothetical protein
VNASPTVGITGHGSSSNFAAARALHHRMVNCSLGLVFCSFFYVPLRLAYVEPTFKVIALTLTLGLIEYSVNKH